MGLPKIKDMKTTLLLFLLALSGFTQAQDKYMTRTGHISFFSEAPMENIEAHNKQVTSILDIQKGEMVFSMLMKGFEFEKALMQEHFNESYAESEKYPKCTFKGVITNFSELDLSKDGMYNVTVEGNIDLHGVSKPYKSSGTLEKKDGKFIAKSQFDLNVKDHDIKIPAGKVNNISEVVAVTVDLSYEVYNK